jgi:molybdopterin-guanine dinucleotide biosynthesis protein A
MRSPINRSGPPVGLILAGGPGTRIGGGKANIALHGEPLLHYPLRALRAVVSDVAIITKPQMELPQFEGAMVWVEPDEPLHPVFGICEALALAGGRPVLVCPVDMPFVSQQLLAALAETGSDGRPAVIASCRGEARPLVGRYLPAAAAVLAQAVQGNVPLEELTPMLEPKLLDVEDEVELFDVNTPDDLLLAAGLLDQRYPKVKS